MWDGTSAYMTDRVTREQRRTTVQRRTTQPYPGISGAPGPPSSLTAILVVMVILLIGSLVLNQASIGSVVLIVVMGIPVLMAGRWLASPTDAAWLPTAIAAGYLAKLVASGARYWVLIEVYNGVGDAGGYHTDGLAAADVWRSFSVPEFGNGTDFIAPLVGFFYVPFKPTLLGGFFIFATLAFIGQLFMLAAFRRISTPFYTKLYAAGILFLPTIAYWPSSIGKEAVIFLFMGPAVYGAVRLLSEYRLRWTIPLAIGLLGVGVVREHIAFMLAAALALTLALAKAPPVSAAVLRRLGLLGVGAGILALAVMATSQRFGFDLSAGVSLEMVSEDVDPFLEGLSERTGIGGSAVEGGVIQSVEDIPEALLRVIYRPLPWEADSAQILASGLEGGFLLALTVLRLPAILKNLRHLRRKPFALFSLFFTGGFIFAFSAIVNLGVLARQRSQVLPFLLALLIEMGFRDRTPLPEAEVVRDPIGVPA